MKTIILVIFVGACFAATIQLLDLKEKRIEEADPTAKHNPQVNGKPAHSPRGRRHTGRVLRKPEPAGKAARDNHKSPKQNQRANSARGEANKNSNVKRKDYHIPVFYETPFNLFGSDTYYDSENNGNHDSNYYGSYNEYEINDANSDYGNDYNGNDYYGNDFNGDDYNRNDYYVNDSYGNDYYGTDYGNDSYWNDYYGNDFYWDYNNGNGSYDYNGTYGGYSSCYDSGYLHGYWEGSKAGYNHGFVEGNVDGYATGYRNAFNYTMNKYLYSNSSNFGKRNQEEPSAGRKKKRSKTFDVLRKRRQHTETSEKSDTNAKDVKQTATAA